MGTYEVLIINSNRLCNVLWFGDIDVNTSRPNHASYGVIPFGFINMPTYDYDIFYVFDDLSVHNLCLFYEVCSFPSYYSLLALKYNHRKRLLVLNKY